MALIKLNNNSISAVTALPSAINVGSMTLIKTQTIDTANTISAVDFINGTDGVVLDDTYDYYKFLFSNVHLNGDNQRVYCRMRRSGQSSFDSSSGSYFETGSTTDSSISGFRTNTNNSIRIISGGTDSANSESNQSGELTVFNFNSTIHVCIVNHFVTSTDDDSSGFARVNVGTNYHMNSPTTANDGFRFFASSGNFDTGTFSLYGVKA